MVAITHEDIVKAPKALLHDHLDGGLRPATIVELANTIGHTLPETDPTRLGEWFVAAANSGSLERYLETFAHTVAVMQTEAGLFRVAQECALDLAADGVVYAEVRYAPEQHLDRGLSLDQVVEAVHAGFQAGCAEAAAQGRPIRIGTLLTAMRHAARSQEIAELSVRFRDSGVVGFDIAGAEAGFPPTRHLDAFEYLQRENFHFTIHAGEAFGLPSIWQAIQWCGADRLGHGVRIVDDITGGATGRGRAATTTGGGSAPQWPGFSGPSGGPGSGGGLAPSGGPGSGGGLAPSGGPGSGGGTAPSGGPGSGGGTAPSGGPGSGGGTVPSGGADSGGGTVPSGGAGSGGGTVPSGGAGSGSDIVLGRLAAYVRDKRIPLELCPSSNVQTGAAASIAEHPIGLLHDLRFRVTVNTDNRLMSGTSMSREMALLVEAFGWGWAELQWLTINAMKSAFIPYDERLAIITEVIKPAYAKVMP